MIVLRVASLPLFPVPLPFVPEDFSFLLSSDTFAHGRLTNLAPTTWTHLKVFTSICGQHISRCTSRGRGYFWQLGKFWWAKRGLLCWQWMD